MTGRASVLVAAVAIGPGCAAPFCEDGTSLSVGTHADGALRRAAVLPFEGEDWAVPRNWRERRSNYGTDEAVAFVARVARRLARGFPGTRTLVGDLSRRGGGSSPEHRSHGSGRDVDLFLFAADAAGRPLAAGDAMIRFGPDGKAGRWSPADGHAAPAAPLPAARFDLRRNWAMVRAMLTDPEAEVQWIFVEQSLAAALLGHAASIDEDPALVARAAFILHQPSDSKPHDDHMHVRLYCDVRDRMFGCADRGPSRWWKKRWKWMGGGPAAPSDRIDAAVGAILQLLRSEIPRAAVVAARS